MNGLLKRILKRKEVEYLAIILSVILFAIVINISLATFLNRETRNLANISVVGMDYSMSINAVPGTNMIAPANQVTFVNVSITARNNYSSNYELFYHVCTTSSCDAYANIPANFEIRYSSLSIDKVTDVITSDGTRIIRIAIINNTNSDVFIRLDINAGYAHNPLELIGLITREHTETQTQRLLRNEILANNPLRTGADFSVAATNANRATQEGLFQTTDSHGTAFFFRGTHDTLNNNVLFAGHQWKILRIEGNGNIRMIYNGTCPSMNCSGSAGTTRINGNTAAATATINGASVFNSSADHNRFIGYMYGTSTGTFDQQHAHTTNSTIKGLVDTWFNNAANISLSARQLIANDTLFCIDRTIGNLAAHQAYTGLTSVGTGLATSQTVYATIQRLYPGTGLNNFAPTLICPRTQDRLTLPVGLISYDEASMAGVRMTTNNNDVFLRINLRFWTLSPVDSYTSILVFRVYPGTISAEGGGTTTIGWMASQGTGGVGGAVGVRPVISLRSDVLLTSGNGSLATPYIVLN